MSTFKRVVNNNSALDDDVVEMLGNAITPVEMPVEMKSRLRKDILQQVAKENACDTRDYLTIRSADDKWLSPLPGALVKILNREPDSEGLEGVLSYLFRLEPGFKTVGHSHPVEEECLMLEGDLTLGGLTLYAGDYHRVAPGFIHGEVSSINGCLAFIKGALPV